MDKFPFLGSSHTSLIEKMYEDYLKDSSSVHKQWRDFFQGYNFAKEVYLTPKDSMSVDAHSHVTLPEGKRVRRSAVTLR